MEIKITELQKKLNINFNDKKLLIKALTHKSHNPENNYELLEFLGDRVLGLIISKKLVQLYPDEKVGILDKKLASLVNKNMCFEVGKKLNLAKFILVGNSNSKIKNVENKIISDCCEAIIGAIYIDKGYETAKKFILHVWKDLIISSSKTIVDAKTRLQEYSLKKYKVLPIYKVISNTGPRHKPNFKIGVKIKNSKIVFSTGSSKKIAEQNAANELLKILKL